jgi:hypothetical protein
MKKEFGKWLMDVAKYTLTAIVFSTLFGSIKNDTLLCVFGFVTVCIMLGIGLILIGKKQ